MFKPRSMSKVSILLLDQDLERFTREAQERGLLQFTESPSVESMERQDVRDMRSRIADLQSKVDRAVSVLEDAREEKAEAGGMSQRLKGMVGIQEPPEPLELEFGSVEDQTEWCSSKVEDIHEEVQRFGNTMERIADQRSKLEAALGLIREMLPVKVPLSRFRESDLTSTFFFHLPSETVEPLTQACKDNLDPVHVTVVSGTATVLVMAMCLEEDRNRLLTQIHRFEGEIIELPSYDGRPREIEEDILSELEELEEERSEVTDRIYTIAAERLDDLKITQEVLGIEEERLETLEMLSRTESVVYVRGWVPEDELRELDELVSRTTSGRYVLRSDSEFEEGEDPPTDLDNPGVFSSFEWITKMYGMPNYGEVDPTIFVAPTFAVFFGTCLTDAGYGIILALVSFLVLRKAWGKELGTAFTLCGLGTVLMGWLTGGWFGNILYSGQYGYGPQLAFFKAPWIDPIEDPVSLLVLALMMGIVHLMLGHATAIMSSHRKGNLVQGLITHIGWLLTLSFGSIFITWYLEITTANAFWRTISTWGTGIGASMGIIGYILEREGSAMVASIPQFLYDILSHIADVISYSRLLALGISTGVNALLIDYIVVDIAWPSLSSGAGAGEIAIFALVSVALALGFVVLHLVNMALNCLTGFVHTMRLEFAEYFGKFYEGNGDEFSPLKAERTLTKSANPGGGN